MMRFVYWRGPTLRGWRWRWHLKAGNGDIIATSGQSYRNKADCLAAIDLVQASEIAPREERR